MPTKAGLPGWFPEDFQCDPALLAAFEVTVTSPASAPTLATITGQALDLSWKDAWEHEPRGARFQPPPGSRQRPVLPASPAPSGGDRMMTPALSRRIADRVQSLDVPQRHALYRELEDGTDPEQALDIITYTPDAGAHP